MSSSSLITPVEEKPYRKAQSIIQARPIENDFTLNDRKLLNVLIAISRQNPLHTTHTVPIKMITDMFLRSGSGGLRVRESLERLWNNKISIDYKDPNNVSHEIRCNYLSYKLSDVNDGILRFAFDPLLWEMMEHPKVFAIFRVNTTLKFQTKGGLVLYEQMELYWRRHNPTLTLSVMETLDLFEAGSSYANRFDNFKSRILDPAVDEVRKYADFDVQIDYERAGRGGKLQRVHFRCVPKSLQEIVEMSAYMGGPKRKKQTDGGTADMFSPRPDQLKTYITDETVQEAKRLIGHSGSYDEYFERWCVSAMGKNALMGSFDPAENFITWLKVTLEQEGSSAFKDIDIESVFSSLLSENP